MVPLGINWKAQPEKASRWVFLGGLVVGGGFFAYYYLQGLTVSHYDAKAHLLVARRIVDSLEPGYSQMGAHWLPLTHLVYLPFVIFDLQYKSGFLPSLISVLAFAVSGWLVYRIAHRMTGSVPAGIFAAAVLLGNPNVQYLQSCPLTEPLYMVLLLLAIDSLDSWRESDHSRLPWIPAVWLTLGAFCRYEGWYVLAGVLLLLLHDFGRQYMPRRKVIQAAAVLLTVFVLPAVMHFGYIYVRLGDTFFGRVAQGNASPYLTYKRPFLSILYHLSELTQVAASIPLILAAGGVLLVLCQPRLLDRRIPLFLLWIPSLINISALYWGLIYRVRYSSLLIPAVAIFGCMIITSAAAKRRVFLLMVLAAMIMPWLSWYYRNDPGGRFVPGPGALLLPAAGALLFMVMRVRGHDNWALLVYCILAMQVPLLAREVRPMLVETLEHEFIEPERHAVMQYVLRHYDGKRILIDMGRQAPLIYDLGLNVKEFIYNEGGTTAWHEAVRDPVKHVGWMISENGDTISERLRVDPGWAAGYALVLQTEHFSLYRLQE